MIGDPDLSVGSQNDIDFELSRLVLTKRRISHDEAQEAVGRLVNSHFNNPGEHARMSIPANSERDDDLVLSAYILQQRDKDREFERGKDVGRAIGWDGAKRDTSKILGTDQ